MQSVGIRTHDYDIKYDEIVKKEVIDKFTKMVDDPNFGERYTVISGALCYYVNSNLSETNVFILYKHIDEFRNYIKDCHNIFVPGITPLRNNSEQESGFYFHHREAAYICSKLEEWAKVQSKQAKQKETVAKELQANDARKYALEKLANIR